eukprot:IDg13846t1
MYLMIGTRPDIAFAVGILSQFSENPRLEHWIASKRVLRYVKGGTVCWQSKKQTTISTSTFEAEYISLCSSTNETIRLSRILAEMI